MSEASARNSRCQFCCTCPFFSPYGMMHDSRLELLTMLAEGIPFELRQNRLVQPDAIEFQSRVVKPPAARTRARRTFAPCAVYLRGNQRTRGYECGASRIRRKTRRFQRGNDLKQMARHLRVQWQRQPARHVFHAAIIDRCGWLWPTPCHRERVHLRSNSLEAGSNWPQNLQDNIQELEQTTANYFDPDRHRSRMLREISTFKGASRLDEPGGFIEAWQVPQLARGVQA